MLTLWRYLPFCILFLFTTPNPWRGDRLAAGSSGLHTLRLL